MSMVASPLDVSGGQVDYNQVDRGADNPHRNMITKPVREAKARLCAVVPLMMMMITFTTLIIIIILRLKE
jgi:hypothetical protein